MTAPDPKFQVGDRVYIAPYVAVGTVTNIEMDYEYVDLMSANTGLVTKILKHVNINYKVRFYEDNSGYREGTFHERELALQPELPFAGEEATPDNSAFTIWLEERKKK